MKTINKLSLQAFYEYDDGSGKMKKRTRSYNVKNDLSDENLIVLAGAIDKLTQVKMNAVKRNEVATLS